MTDKNSRGMDAKVNECMWAFVGYAARCKPIIAAFESVRQAYTNGHPLMTKLRAKLEAETGWRYNLYHVIHNAYEVGGAAIRRRYFWVAVRDDHPFGVRFPHVRQPVLRDVWEDLGGLQATWETQPYKRPATWWSAAHVRKEGMLGVDGHVGLTSLAADRINDVLQMANLNGGWPVHTSLSTMLKSLYERHGKLPDSWNYRIDRLIEKNFEMGFTIPYRWHPERAARVIIGGALNLVVHPWEDRLITHREAARVMGFPDDWRISTMKRTSALRLTWGKGITVQCGSWLSGHVKDALDGNPGENSGVQVADQEWVIESTPKYGIVQRTNNDIAEGIVNV